MHSTVPRLRGCHGHTSERDSRAWPKQQPFQAQAVGPIRGVLETARARWIAAWETPSTAAACRVLNAAVLARVVQADGLPRTAERLALGHTPRQPGSDGSTIRARSNSAIAPRMCICSLPAGVVSSIPSASGASNTEGATLLPSRGRRSAYHAYCSWVDDIQNAVSLCVDRAETGCAVPH
jgi:hypothetical protein